MKCRRASRWPPSGFRTTDNFPSPLAGKVARRVSGETEGGPSADVSFRCSCRYANLFFVAIDSWQISSCDSVKWGLANESVEENRPTSHALCSRTGRRHYGRVGGACRRGRDRWHRCRLGRAEHAAVARRHHRCRDLRLRALRGGASRIDHRLHLNCTWVPTGRCHYLPTPRPFV